MVLRHFNIIMKVKEIARYEINVYLFRVVHWNMINGPRELT